MNKSFLPFSISLFFKFLCLSTFSILSSQIVFSSIELEVVPIDQMRNEYTANKNLEDICGFPPIKKMTLNRNLEVNALFPAVQENELNLPGPYDIRNIAQYSRSGNRACREKIDLNIKNWIASFSDQDNQEALMVIASHIRDVSILKHPPELWPIYMYGLPAETMTALIQDLGKALSLYVCEINLDSIQPQDLLGPEQFPSELALNMTTLPDYKVLGKIGSCLRESTHNNIIVFFNRADSVLNSIVSNHQNAPDPMKIRLRQELFKEILSYSNPFITFKSIEVKFPSNRITYLFAGHSPILPYSLGPLRQIKKLEHLQ